MAVLFALKGHSLDNLFPHNRPIAALKALLYFHTLSTSTIVPKDKIIEPIYAGRTLLP